MQTLQPTVRRQYYLLVLLFVAVKVILNLLAAPHYGFHRDELLHLALGDHLAWGYKEVPPVIGVLAYWSIHLFGSTVVAARVFPTIAAALLVWFTGLLTVGLGGKRFAIALACLSMLFSPAFAASDYLFQPVVFDQLWWLLSAWLAVKYVNTKQAQYLYWLGMIVGIGLLTKYSMAFFAIALLLGMMLTPQRKLLTIKSLLITLLITALVFLPNIIWQYQHHWPFITHMHKLKQQQLEYVSQADFIMQQILTHGLMAIVWLAGLLYLVFSKRLKSFRFLAWAYILVFLFLLLMHGKSYYLFGAYPMLFAAGGFAFEQLIHHRFYALRTAVLIILVLPGLLFLPLVLPILRINQTLSVFSYMQQHAPFLNFITRWEDLKQHKTTQDYADMLGWEEMTKKVATAYQHLPAAEQASTVIFTDNYGEAAAIHHYHQQYHLPDVTSLNSSFALWAPAQLKASNIIYVSDDADVSDLVPLAESCKNTGSIQNPLAREYGTVIFLIAQPKPGLQTVYHQHWLLEQGQ